MLLRFILMFALVGLAVSCSKPRVAQKPLPPAVPTPTQMPPIPEGWRRIEVGGKFVFYIPGDMQKQMDIGEHSGPHGGFSNGHLRLGYGYATEDLCSPKERFSQQAGYTRTEMIVADKRAVVETSGPHKLGWSLITICFFDIGDGKTRLHFGASSRDPHQLDVARQVFASIHFL